MLDKVALKTAMAYPLSDEDIQTILKPDTTNIIQYPDLVDVTDINTLFDAQGRCVVFIPLSKSFGHWCCLIRSKKLHTIEWFDPYAIKPDDEKKWISKVVLKQLHEDKPYLTNLLRQAHEQGTRIIYNPYHWQAERDGVSDCGRWVALRCLLHDKPLSDINKMIKKSKLTPDAFVTNVIYEILGK